MTAKVARAQLLELDASFRNLINQDAWVTVQFNPESLKVSFDNKVSDAGGVADQGGGASKQVVGTGTTKLAVQLWFDVSSDAEAPVDDVRKLTQKVAYFITAQPVPGKPHRPPVVRFLWGSFQFDGIVESIEESLEFFSPEGRPLRASVSLLIIQQGIQFVVVDPVPVDAPTGTRPLTAPPPGTSLQQLVARNGGGDWQAIANANDVDNPRFPAPDRPLDLGRRA